jgi:ribosome-associated protein
VRIVIPPDEIQWRFTGSGGPGGQHANTSNTRVELVWSIEDSALPDDVKERLVAKLGATVRVVSSGSRSQTQNRETALERLNERVERALHADPPRRPTRPTRGSNERRLADKKRRAAQKQDRRDES